MVFLIDNRTLASTNLSEKFHDETFRKTSGSYDKQGALQLELLPYGTHKTI